MDVVQTMVIDGDDTLWMCGVYYFNAMKSFAEISAHRTGLDATFCRKMLDTIDGAMTSLPGAFNRDRFPKSFKATSLALDAISGNPVNLTAAEAMFEVADSVFSEEYPMYEGVRDTLVKLKEQGVTLILNTKGDNDVQWMKIRNNNLEPIFDHISVTLKKDIPYYENMRKKFSLDTQTTVFMGDSMRDDIIAPNSLGYRTILVSTKPPSEWKGKWSYEANIDGPIDPTWWVKAVPEVLSLNLVLPVVTN